MTRRCCALALWVPALIAAQSAVGYNYTKANVSAQGFLAACCLRFFESMAEQKGAQIGAPREIIKGVHSSSPQAMRHASAKRSFRLSPLAKSPV